MKSQLKYILLLGCVCASVFTLWAQADRSEIRKGNKEYAKGAFATAEIDYRRALEKDSTSIPAHYNLSNTLYKQEKYDQAENGLKTRMDSIAEPIRRADAFHNLGNMQLAQKKYAESIASYKDALRLRPQDMETKSNLAYAQKMLKNQQDQQQNQDNKDQDKDKQDQNQDQKDQNPDQNKDKQDQQQPSPKITPQSAQQMLEAMQNKEKETQEKVNKEKAKAAQPVKSEKNW